MITVYGRATSSNVQSVMWCAAELGLTVNRLDYGFDFGGTDTPEFLAMNPNGKVPVLTDGDLVMFESAAIVRYLAARYGAGGLWPRDPAARAAQDVWAEWIKTTFGPALLHGLFYPLVRRNPALLSPDVVRSGELGIAPLAQMLADRIGRGPYLGGEELTWADIMAGHLLYRYYDLTFDRADLPGLRAYYDRLCNRPAYRTHVCVSYEPLRYREGEE